MQLVKFGQKNIHKKAERLGTYKIIAPAFCGHQQYNTEQNKTQTNLFGGTIMKLRKIMMAVMATAILAASAAVPASAATSESATSPDSETTASSVAISPQSNQDRGYTFKFSTNWWQDQSTGYLKENTTSVYLKSTTFPGKWQVYTNGLINGKYVDCTSRAAHVPSNGEFFIYNNIYENAGYKNTYAKLGGYRAGGGTAAGVWSPDSVGSYPHINP